ncbi:hypothetical protein SERLA73DRAFT_175643 [Serpula lacrymans var. lacrymans S7.3]|uniref:Extracellular membrane protein CFEM domain-containing protein n=2 Tax=Serpula lacrymans var. lacrymans TaxID=341189 RepID=F8PL35_SERL3|nr:uncharacterized protein SERLADRAFT_458192 [Serpula lacrymans var. lacrymans S7.9]EGO03943.1 hypothetical protein SERLA73DRAFT_175643 [Serpula lacrymans var. lacrymans S7.3]EGO29864.1 hypothetical protein SERLADRAFT_458192 [Serpula lacrymans var. lacrymans S7.9]
MKFLHFAFAQAALLLAMSSQTVAQLGSRECHCGTSVNMPLTEQCCRKSSGQMHGTECTALSLSNNTIPHFVVCCFLEGSGNKDVVPATCDEVKEGDSTDVDEGL